MQHQVKSYLQQVVTNINKIFGFGLFAVICLFTNNSVQAQNSLKTDTVYYLVNTSKIPVKDRIIETGIEGQYSYYSILCRCYPQQANPVFSYLTKKPRIVISKRNFEKIKPVSLTQLIDIAVQFGLDRKPKTVFYFLEPIGESYVMNKVVLLEPINRNSTN